MIIDHLMPPMTRAETYGEMAELEGLVDEFYQAMGMDQARENWLREAILQQLNDSNLREELLSQTNLNHAEQADENVSQEELEETLLSELDAYLCDIKEAQIRHGLHIMGELPASDKLADTLVALLRLPRGDADDSRGILDNIALDLDLRIDGELFEPLTGDHSVWTGEQPPILQLVTDAAWRTQADTRERLELVAKALIKQYVLNDDSDAGLLATDVLNQLPHTAAQLEYVNGVIYRALQQSAELEIKSLISGLSGGFVPPGPSGAPTRGRLDTLPTGRNFFAVDNRAIPSPAAWAIGERSAAALIERHLQEHGDYPKQIGLSVWGTATMRTGGDDIAQAMALMGVRPIWAPGSNRVVDFEVVSCQRLGRPRVDVTLRVSGFFRDAFPNVMKLYDAAVQAVAALDEPGNGNTIQANIEARRAELVAEGMSAEDAERQASFRVFGSKPGPTVPVCRA